MIRTYLSHEKIDAAIGGAVVTAGIVLTLWTLTALVVGTVQLVRVIEGAL